MQEINKKQRRINPALHSSAPGMGNNYRVQVPNAP